MDEVIWVETLSRQLGVIARQRCSGKEIRIGRAYCNDVVLDDPFVAAEHLRIARDENGVLTAEDLGSANGLYVGNGKQRVQRVAIDGDHPLRIGHTLLRIRESGHDVAPEHVTSGMRSPLPTICAIGVAVILLQASILWLNETTEPRVTSYLPTLIGMPAIALAWVAGWAVLCRIFSSHARFERNLLIALSGLLAYSVVTLAAQFLSFALSWRPLAAYQYVAAWCFLAAICVFHLREISAQHLPLKAGIAAMLACLAIATETVIQFDVSANGPRNYSLLLMPPALRLVSAKSEDAFFADVDKLKRKLDQDRAEGPNRE